MKYRGISWFLVFSLARSVPYFTPIQILRPTPDHRGLVATEALSSILSSSEASISVVAVVGPYHSGKSFLLNALAGRTDVFKVGPSTDPETKGLYIARTDRKTEDGKEIWLLDSEGFFGPQIPEEYDAKIFTVAALLADKLVYNTVKVIDQNAVDRLDLLLRRAALFNTKASGATHSAGASAPVGGSGPATPAQRLTALPELAWVVEDFVQGASPAASPGAAAPGAAAAGGSPSGDGMSWLSSYLPPASYISRNFPGLSVHTLFLPATLKPQLRDLSTLRWDELTPEFRVEVARLRLALFSRSSKSYSPAEFVQTAHFLGAALEQGLFPELPSLWSHWQSQVQASSVRDGLKLFEDIVKKNLDDKFPPVGKDKFGRELREAEERAVGFFLALVGETVGASGSAAGAGAASSGGSGVRIGIPETLIEGIQSRATASARIHQEKVEQFIAGKVRDAVSEFRAAAGKIPLPTEPEGLSVALGKAREGVISEVEAVAGSVGAGSPHGLAGELQAIAASLAEENSRKIALVLQTASQTASSFVEEALGGVSQTEKLLGAQELRAFELELKEKAVRKFEAATDSNRPWIRSLPVYHSTSQNVQGETQAKLTRFQAQHAVKVSEVFRKIGDRVLAEYREARKELELRSLPAEEGGLKERHIALEGAIAERFTELAGNLVDTETFKVTKTRLFESVKVEFQKLLRKNVELWKVHSDEATQCAVGLNGDVRKQQCWNGWMCLFALWPPTHKAVTRANLNSCFDKAAGTGGGAAIPRSMRDSVFESFYEKEMSKEVADVQRNLWITAIAVLAPLVWWTLLKINRQ